MTSEPMTPERFAAIKGRHQEVRRLYGEFWVDAGPTDADLDAVIAEVERLRCTDPIECGHEAALGQAQAEVERLNGVVQLLGSHLQRDSLDIVDELKRQAAQEPLAEAEELRAEVQRLTEERDQAVAHDRQPYPTQWAYDQACAALEKHRQRADAAEAVMRRALNEVEHEEVVYLLNRYLTAAGAQG